jgi:hypothetical protein
MRSSLVFWLLVVLLLMLACDNDEFVFPWEDESEVESRFTFNVDPDSCGFYQNGTQSFCDYLDIEWPADGG